MTRVSETAASVDPSYLAGAPASMDTISALPPSVENPPLPTPTPPSESNRTKQEQPDMTNTHTVDIPPPPFINSINGLRTLSTALSTFLRRYDELHDHLNFIKTSIDSKLPNHLVYTANPNHCLTPLTETAHTITAVPETMVPEQNPNGTSTNCERIHESVGKPEETNILKKRVKTDSSTKPQKTVISKKPQKTVISKKPEKTDVSKKPEKTDVSKKPAVSELENHCEKMCGRDMKKYVATYISDMNKLRDEIPKALKLAKDPAKLVLESIGRFYLQGSRAYFKGSHQVVGRLASVLILECFVMISSDGIEIAKEEKEYAAKVVVDWKDRIIRDGGFANTDEVDARGLLLLISGFGIPDRVFKNEDIRDLIKASNVKEISSVLRRSIILIPRIPEVIDWMVKNDLEIEAADIAYTFGLEDKCHPQTIIKTFLHNKIKDRQHGSTKVAAMKKQLSSLKSVRRCLEAHKVDPSKLLPDCKINEKIQQLEKERDLESGEDKAAQKRKEPSRKHKQKEAKRTCRENGKSPYNGLTQSSSSYLDGNLHNSSSVLRAPGTGLSENITNLVAIQSGGGSYGTGLYGGAYPDQMLNGRPYDSALIHKYLGQPYLRQVQTYDSQPSTGLVGFYSGQSRLSSLETFPGLPRSSPLPGFSATASNLYSFADTVDVQNGSYYASGSGTMRSSNLY